MNKVRINGRDLKNAGYRPGPQYIVLLNIIKEARENQLILNDGKDVELNYLRSKGLYPLHVFKF